MRIHHVLAATAAAGAACALPAAASADSLTYIKDHNVWVSDVTGADAHQVTTDGTASAPYDSPSQDDNGVIAATRSYAIWRFTQGGRRLSRFVPSNLKDSTGHSTSGSPAWIALSPDGTKVAYGMTSHSCDLTIDCGVRATIGVASADGSKAYDTPGLFGAYPSWITNDRLLFHGGYLYQNQVWNLGSADKPWNWFDDQDQAGAGTSTDLEDGEVSADGRRFIERRGYGDSSTIIWYDVTGDIRSGPNPGQPTALCITSESGGLEDSTISADGDFAAWREPDGIWAKTNLGSCDSPPPALIVAGGSDPDWSPAANAPKADDPPLKKKKPKRKKKHRRGHGRA